ncbi:MAG: hypothetical protein KBC53_01555, partial [Nitrosomonas sp.]|nr:hypothetical protein [Nitrosomonas sp.]
ILEKRGVSCIVLESSAMENIDATFAQHESLFNSENAFFIENILSKKHHRDALKSYIADTNLLIHVWEETIEDRNLKKYFPKAQFVVHAVQTTLWKLLDGIYPGNLTSSLRSLSTLYASQEPIMILYMLQQRAKELILVKNSLSGKMRRAPWQEKTLLGQAQRWQDTHLKQFYKKLYDIEFGTKTGTQPYSIKEALDILFCFYLQK